MSRKPETSKAVFSRVAAGSAGKTNPGTFTSVSSGSTASFGYHDPASGHTPPTGRNPLLNRTPVTPVSPPPAPLDTGRISAFAEGARESTDRRARASLDAAVLIGGSMAAWSAWKHHRRTT